MKIVKISSLIFTSAMKRACFTFILLFLCVSVFAQKRRYSYKQYIPINYWITDSYTIKNGDTLSLPAGTIIETEKEVVRKGIKTTYTSSDTLKKVTLKPFDKKKEYRRKLPGIANVYVKEDDYSKLYVDYWLTTETYFPKDSELIFVSEGNQPVPTKLKKSAGYRYYTVDDFEIAIEGARVKLQDIPAEIERISNSIDSLSSLLNNGSQQESFQRMKESFIAEGSVEEQETQRKTDEKIRIELEKAKEHFNAELNKIYNHPDVQEYLWSAYAMEKILARDKRTGETITYFKKYPENAYISLENRQYVKLGFSAWEIAALTIPFKYRSELSENEVTVPSEFSTDFNVSTFVAKTWGNLNYRNQSSEKVKPFGSSVAIGAFFGFNPVALDSTNTSLLAARALSETRNVIFLTTGVGAVYNFLDFDIGVFFGKDYGVGSVGRKWNYHDEFWIGFGVGYNLSILGGGG